MEDRFEFRAKRIDNNQWYYGCYLFLKNPPQYDWTNKKKESKGDIHFIIDENDINYAIDPQTLGQCTGLKDKNGKLIFEGDIVKYTSKQSKKNADERIKPYTCNFLVVWDEKYTGYKLQNEKRVDCLNLGIMTEDIEIIGNVYETPELLKGEADG